MLPLPECSTILLHTISASGQLEHSGSVERPGRRARDARAAPSAPAARARGPTVRLRQPHRPLQSLQLWSHMPGVRPAPPTALDSRPRQAATIRRGSQTHSAHPHTGVHTRCAPPPSPLPAPLPPARLGWPPLFPFPFSRRSMAAHNPTAIRGHTRDGIRESGCRGVGQ